jgi:two-component system phosphate regulon response regulator PhoB/two-component system alkaline phosphatase synthesis response regulator PhoP
MPPPASKKILLIEDDILIAELLGEGLSAKYYIKRSATGEEALSTLSEERPDLIILDILLPGIDGFEVLRRLKADPATANIPVIVLSNLSGDEDIAKAKELGAAEFIVKITLSPEEIVAHIAQILDRAA